jgi:cysteinyl-tRNA synthetase
VEVAPFKEDPMDFVLWKPSEGGLPGWDSPWGYGRPGWHIECSAMAKALLGERFDIHAGGLDLQFPHHENEIAQSVCAHGGHGPSDMAQVWLHNEMLLVEGKKMSKSLGNFFTVRELLDKGWPGEVIRAALLLSHYREPMDFGVRRRHEATQAVAELARTLGSNGTDTLSTPEAMRLLNRRALVERYGPTGMKDRLPDILASQILLGFDLRRSPTARDQARQSDDFKEHVVNAIHDAQELEKLANEIGRARESRNFTRADAIRAALIEAGAEVSISKDRVSVIRLPGFDPSKLKAVQ